MDLKGRDFLKLLDFTSEEIVYLLDLAADLKDKKKKGIPVDQLRGKNVALIFEKTSTRTRCSFEVAAHDLGMGCTYLDPAGSQIGKKESIADTARVLGRMLKISQVYSRADGLPEFEQTTDAAAYKDRYRWQDWNAEFGRWGPDR